ncbi:hypothetical protein BRADI_4g13208v3 [Brachypodium distachyon]|uniref:Uncharacterized protein n=1 Tax=Brachypodium distachyon TaxID=15368 RepID=I1IK81_BRADI|nr:hypothetical protein BRADI_4g13208v3 [Brachypodium distachyon]
MDPSPTRHRGAFLMTESSRQDHDGGSARQLARPAPPTCRRRFKVGRVRFRQIGSSRKDHGRGSVRQTPPDFAASATNATTLRPLSGLALPTATPPLGALAPPTVLSDPAVDLPTCILLGTQSEDKATSLATELIFTEFNFADLESDIDKTDSDDEDEYSIKA